jgi:H+-transporting ATPase
MEAAAILAFALKDWIDAAVIVAILILNAIVGWYQEKQISSRLVPALRAS